MAVAKSTTKAAPKKAPAPKASQATDAAFAVIHTGGKQYQVSVGDTIIIEKFATESTKGDVVTFDSVVLSDSGADTVIGSPYITGASVTGEVVMVGRAPTVTVIKYKQKSRYFKKNGHRQPYVKVKITGIK